MKSNKEIKQNNQEDLYNISVKEYCALDPSERKKWAPIPPKYEKIPIFCKVSLIIAILSVILYIISCISTAFADFFSYYVGAVIRFILAKISSIFIFSLAEAFVLLLPIIAFLAIWYVLKFRCESRKSTLVVIACTFSIAALFLSCFTLSFGISYKTSPLDEKLGLDRATPSKEELYESMLYLTEKVNSLSQITEFGEDGFSSMPYSFNEMNSKLLDAYEDFCQDHDFISTFGSRLKPVMLSEGLSYMHITGVYTFFTGESNINIAFPDYTIPFTAAHELAHQRGIAREDEANMIAFLVCIESDDPYIQYSAYLNVYEYVAHALYKADKELYQKVRANINTHVKNEQKAYSEFYEKYSDSVASKISGAVNDTYLKAQGTAGTISYGMVVDLTIAYLKNSGLIPIK